MLLGRDWFQFEGSVEDDVDRWGVAHVDAPPVPHPSPAVQALATQEGYDVRLSKYSRVCSSWLAV